MDEHHETDGCAAIMFWGLVSAMVWLGLLYVLIRLFAALG